MLIRTASDLHTEFWAYNKFERIFNNILPPLPADKDTVLILPGDIGTFSRYPSSIKPALNILSKRFRQVLYIYGNHEWYNSAVWGAEKEFWTDKRKPKNVTILQDSFVIIDHVLFLGSTLWTDFDSFDELAMHAAARGMNDFHCIKTGYREDLQPYSLQQMQPLTPQATVNAHLNSKKFIFEALAADGESGALMGALLPEDEQPKRVVITHHCPSEKSVHKKYKGDILNYAFFSELSPEIEHCGPDLWFHGHTHESFDYQLGKTRVICNPFGYKDREENKNYNPELVLEV